MNTQRLSCILLALAVIPGALYAGDEKVAFEEALMAYYEITGDDVTALKETGLALEEMPVALHWASPAMTSPVNLATLRARGDSWQDIAHVRQVGPSSVYIRIGKEFTSTIYEPIFAKFTKVKGATWTDVPLTSDDIVNLVNLKFLSSYYGYSMFEIMAMRDGGADFVSIAATVKEAKQKQQEEQKRKAREEKRKKREQESSN